MKIPHNIIHITILLLMVWSCSIPIDPESYDYEASIVVDGQVTDEFKHHEVSLVYSRPINKENSPVIGNASVRLETGSGALINYSKTLNGLYYQSDVPFAGEPGESYQLHFTLENGKSYQSTPQTLIKSPQIDSIYDRYVKIATEQTIKNVGGIQFFLDSHDETRSAQYFRYKWREDYKIVTPFKAKLRFIYPEEIIVPIEDPVNICYASDISKSILIANSLETGNRISEFPIRFVSGETDLLRNRYALQITQYAIDGDTYNYYRKFKELNESAGSLFDQQQGTLVGNISSTDDPFEVVLGYFEVAGKSELRTYFNFEDLDPRFPYPYYRTDCGPGTIANVTEDSLFSYGIDLNLIRYYEASRRADIGAASCTDCTGYGVTIKPDFWID